MSIAIFGPSTPETVGPGHVQAARWLFPLAGFAMTLIWGTLSLLRLRAMYGLGFDLGFYLQQVWLISRGLNDGSLANLPMFADHFSPILAIFVPLADATFLAEVMVALQACAFGVSIWLLGDTVHRFAPNRSWWVLCYLVLSPVVGFTLLFDFHPTVLGLPLLVVALRLSWTASSTAQLLAVMAASLTIREDVALLVAAVVLMGERGRAGHRIVRVVAGLIVAGAIAYVVFGTAFLSNVTTHPIQERYDWLGAILAAPSSTDLSGVFSAYLPVTLLVVFFPLALFPSAASAGTTILALLNSGMQFAADFVPADSIYYQYHVLSVYLVAWSLAVASSDSNARKLKERGAAVTLVSIAVAVSLGPLAAVDPPVAVKDRWVPFILDEQHRSNMNALREAVPAGASVSASTTLVRLFAQRKEIYGFPDPLTCRDRFTSSRRATSHPDYIALDLDRGEAELDLVNRLSYRTVATAGHAVLFRAPSDAPEPETCGASSPDMRAKGM